MSKKDFFLVASTAAICSLVAYLGRTTTSTPPDALRSETSAAFENHATALGKPDVNAVQVEAGKQGEAAASAVQQISSQGDSDNHSDDSRTKDPAVVFQRRQELGKRFSELLNSGGNSDPSVLGAKLENRFYSEEWNQEWAGSKEASIRNLFVADGNLSGITPLQVACRSKHCQVVFSASNQGQVRLVSEKFMQAATRGDIGMKDKVVAFFPDVSMGRVVFYFSENGNMDLFQ